MVTRERPLRHELHTWRAAETYCPEPYERPGPRAHKGPKQTPGPGIAHDAARWAWPARLAGSGNKARPLLTRAPRYGVEQTPLTTSLINHRRLRNTSASGFIFSDFLQRKRQSFHLLCHGSGAILSIASQSTAAAASDVINGLWLATTLCQCLVVNEVHLRLHFSVPAALFFHVARQQRP